VIRLTPALARCVALALAAAVSLLVAQLAFATAPTADFTISPKDPHVNQQVTFTSTSSDTADGDLITKWEWDFDYNGATFSPDSIETGATAHHIYTSAGQRTVALRVTDANNEVSSIATKKVTVANPPAPSNNPPTADFDWSPKPTFAGQSVTFSSTSTDPDGDPLTTHWELDGDNDFNDAPQRSYPDPGSYTASLRVDDGKGGSDTVTKTVVVSNRDPQADFGWSPSPPHAGQLVTFSSTSTDPDGDPLTTHWELDGDNDFNDPPQRTYPSVGTYTAMLRVDDNHGGSNTVTKTVTVDNSGPVASFAVSPASPLTNEATTLTSTSTDPEGDPLTYSWDLDGDDSFDDSTARSVMRSFPFAGRYRVQLRVSDGHSGEQTVSKFITVRNRPPIAAFTVAPQHPLTGQTVALTSFSSDPDGGLASRNQAWDLDNDGQFDDALGPLASKSFSTAGHHTVRLRVVDANNAAAIAAGTIDVRARTASSDPPELMSPFPVVRIVGQLTTTGANIKRLSVRAPRGARLKVKCHGRSCPYKRASKILRTRRTKIRGLQRRLRAGTRIAIYVTQEGKIGKYTRFRIRRRKAPARTDQCLMPGASKPSRCPGD
jgi:PKD repeat protein